MKTYILLKNTPELKKGAIMREMCPDGDQDFICINQKEFLQKEEDKENGICQYSRFVVMNSPEWFEEIIPLTIPARLATKVAEFIETLK